MRVGVLFIVALCAACAAGRPAGSSTASTAAAAPTASAPGAAPAWRYTLPANWNISQVRIDGDAVVLGGRTDVRVLDAATGRLRWQHDGGASAMTLDDGAVYYGSRGEITSRTLTTGGTRWERPAVCPSATDNTALLRVAAIVRHADDLVVGCWGGRLARLDAASGRILAQSDSAFVAQTISDIIPLGTCAYGISGWSDGAALRGHAAIVDCKQLRAIVREEDEMVIVGSIGNIAVLDERCCNGRPEVYRPATIVLANLTTGALSPEVDLTPEPNLYPADHRPIGQGSAALLEGTELYLLVERTLYRYGDPRTLSPNPQRVAANLVDFPTFLPHGMLAVRLRSADGGIDDEIVRIRNGRLEPVWSSRESRLVMFGNVTDGILTVRTTDGSGGQTLVRADDGTSLFVSGPCRLSGASRALALMICTTNTLVGNRYVQYLAAYHWPSVPIASPAPGAAPR